MNVAPIFFASSFVCFQPCLITNMMRCSTCSICNSRVKTTQGLLSGISSFCFCQIPSVSMIEHHFQPIWSVHNYLNVTWIDKGVLKQQQFLGDIEMWNVELLRLRFNTNEPISLLSWLAGSLRKLCISVKFSERRIM